MSDTVPVQPNSAAAADINTDIGHYPWGLEQEDWISTHVGGGSQRSSSRSDFLRTCTCLTGYDGSHFSLQT